MSMFADPKFDAESVHFPTVVVRNVSRRYLVKGHLFVRKREYVTAVRNVSLVAEQGESIGLLGQNGSGKSTLLRMIAGAEKPTSGHVYTSSQPTLLGVGAALIPHLSGSSNVKLGCLAMGMTAEEADEAYDDIVAMADIGDAINRPMSTYSSGMGARLRFAIGTAGSPELLIVDEALSTGDAAFASKAEARMRALLDKAGTLFLVSHSGKEIERNCARAIWMHYGEVVADGDSPTVCEQYRIWVQHRATEAFDKADGVLKEAQAEYVEPNILFDSELE